MYIYIYVNINIINYIYMYKYYTVPLFLSTGSKTNSLTLDASWPQSWYKQTSRAAPLHAPG